MADHLRWKKDKKETGLRRVGAGPRGSKLHDGVTVYASVSALIAGFGQRRRGWYWVAINGVPYRNTCDEPCADEATAKAQAMAYVKEHLKKEPQA